MSTVIRPELSENNKYYVEKHRYYELKHFCLQYPIWKKAYLSLNRYSSTNEIADDFTQYDDPTAQCAIAMDWYSRRMSIVEQVCLKTDGDLYSWILIGVTTGSTYDNLKLKHYIPCSRDTYYDRYRKFFFLLNKVRE